MPQGESGQSENHGDDIPSGGRRLPGRHASGPQSPDGRRGHLDGGPSLHARAEATRQLTTRPPRARQAAERTPIGPGPDDVDPVDDRDGVDQRRGRSRKSQRPTGRNRSTDRRDPGRRNRPRQDRDEEDEEAPGFLANLTEALTRDRSGPNGRVLSDATVARIGATVLWVVLIVAAYGGVAAWLGTGDSGGAAAEPAGADTAADGRWTAAGFAERYLAAYLSAGSEGDVLTPYLGYTPDLPATAQPADTISPLRTVDVRSGGDTDYWSVTLAVGTPDPPVPTSTEAPDSDDSDSDDDSDPSAEGNGTPPGELFWQVAVDNSGPQPVAVGLPAPVPPPDRPERAEDTYTLRLPPQDDPMVDSAEGFLAAYLCGAADLDRYLHPEATASAPAAGEPAPDTEDEEDAPLTPADPPICSAVSVERWATGTVEPGPDGDTESEGARHTVLAEVTFDDGSDARRATYGLTLARRDGRWEVAAVLAAPPRQER